ncbi:hypothetical protein [Burkholderia alba]|uniref:hypothetical protein n=1 Tax=Burkholderia alba TaxID=2683677 RepID=UPI002B058F67|nr:hypothetical protein [Burkholderia alba]
MLTQSQFNGTLRWEDFVQNLILNAGGATSVATDRSGPILRMYAIRFADLEAPQALRALMSELSSSPRVVDRGRATCINDDALGAMRQIHANDPMYLPRFAYANRPDKPNYLAALSDRARLYERYVCANKGHSNDRGGGVATTGYVEYTAGTNDMFRGGNRARIAFDYVGAKLYFSPIHYEVWALATPPSNPGRTLPKQADGPYANPWFWITDITST